MTIRVTGTYAGAGWLIVNRNTTANVTDYVRWLDLDGAVARSSWKEGSTSLTR